MRLRLRKAKQVKWSWLQVDLRTEYEWKEDAPSQTVADATVWKAKQRSGNIYEVLLSHDLAGCLI